MDDKYLLDCTLRDGGYCNNWMFGEKNIIRMVRLLSEARIDFIECGYLDSTAIRNADSTRYTSFEDIDNILSYVNNESHQSKYLCMIDYGKFDSKSIPMSVDTNLDGIRVAFRKEDTQGALLLCEELKKKGYLVFVQPMLTMSYSRNELIELISKINDINPFAVYIVDSFGVMRRRDLAKYSNIFAEFLTKGIVLGYHSHNNMQLSYSNANYFLEEHTSGVVIDATIFGMGRGAGNLNTELAIECLNEYAGDPDKQNKYIIESILEIYADILRVFYMRKPWGYSMHNYLSAKYNCHPNYAMYLNNKNTLTAADISDILRGLADEKKNSYDENYIEKLYEAYMNRDKNTVKNIALIENELEGRKVLIIVPSKSSELYIEEIEKERDLNTKVITVNFSNANIQSDYEFYSNIKRYLARDKKPKSKVIVTSNIGGEDAYACLDYETLTNEYKYVKDNAVLLLIKFLISCKVKSIRIVGLDGYSHNVDNNYGYNITPNVESNENISQKNNSLERAINEYAQYVKIELATPEKYIHLKNNTRCMSNNKEKKC